MDISEARAVIRTLARGVDPVTGEVFSDDSPYNSPQVIRALYSIHDASLHGNKVRKTAEQRRQENLANGRPRNWGLPWSDEERQQVASGFEKGSSIPELALAVKRTEGAIQAELVKQGLLEAPAEWRPRAGAGTAALDNEPSE